MEVSASEFAQEDTVVNITSILLKSASFSPFIFTTLHKWVSILRLKIDYKMLGSTERKNAITFLVQQKPNVVSVVIILLSYHH